MINLFIKLLSGLLFIGITFAGAVDVFSQSHVYKHYGVEDGLPSSEVYSAFQDSKGYMWFATDAGVSRFNGYEFENFDVSDGLTDNTVFLITEDVKGRIWFGTFNCQLSYYKDGIIYPYKFNNVLSEVLIQKGAMQSFYVDSNETIWIGFQRDGLYKIDKEGIGGFVDANDEGPQLRIIFINNKVVWGSSDGEKQRLNTLGKNSFDFKFMWEISFMNGDADKGFFLFNYEYGKGDNFTVSHHKEQVLMFFGNQIIRLGKNRSIDGYGIKLPLTKGDILYSNYSDDNYLWICVRDKGVYKCKLESDSLFVVEHFLPNISISRVYRDNEDGYWFLTLKEGVIYLSNDEIEHQENNQFSIEHIEIDTLKGELYKLYDNGSITKEKIDSEITMSDTIVYPGKIKYNSDLKYNYSDSSLLVEKFYYSNGVLNGPKNPIRNIIGKSYLVDSNIIYKVSDFGLSIIENSEEVYFSFKEGVPRMWCTSLAKIDGEIWIGTKDGIRIFSNEKITNPFIKNKYLSAAITSMDMLNENVVVIGTKSYGVLVVENDSVINRIDEEAGLVSNLIRTIHVDNQGLIWLGTSKGICKVVYKGVDDYEIYNITKKHGLISAEIKDIASYQNMIYVATSKGLIQFNKTALQPNLIPPLVYVSSFMVNETSKDLSENNEFNYQENNINIVYEGLNYRSLGEVEYQYRMLGIDTVWITTTTMDVRYPTLPFGEYTFQVKAKNEDGIWNKTPTNVNFIIRPPFWLTWWFITLVVLLIIVAVGLVFKYREKKIIEKNEISKKNASTEKRMVELELRALRSQMNPHFIFNILNSIQHYIIINDFRSTNRYIAQFAKLIRTVLHLSEKSVITIQEEIDMLTLYMNLEKMRFNEQFSYEIFVSEEIDVDYDEIPSMLIQPYVENSIWHGLMNKDKKGDIKINLSLLEDQLCCTIEDNGIGREKAEEIKSKRKIEQKSVGMSITKERLDIINENNVNVKTIDLNDGQGNSLGTRIEIKIPYKN